MPHHHALSRFFTRTLLRYVTLSTNNPSFPIKNEILKRGLKKDRSRNKEISFPFHKFFFSTKYQQRKTDNIFKKQNMPLVIRLSKLVLYHLRQGFHFHEQFLSFLFLCFYLRMNLRFKLRECFEFFSHIFPYWRTFYNSYLSVFTHESFLISIDKLLVKL